MLLLSMGCYVGHGPVLGLMRTFVVIDPIHLSLWHLIYLCQILETADAVISFLKGHGMGDDH